MIKISVSQQDLSVSTWTSVGSPIELLRNSVFWSTDTSNKEISWTSHPAQSSLAQLEFSTQKTSTVSKSITVGK